jgi:hypothetical protein
MGYVNRSFFLKSKMTYPRRIGLMCQGYLRDTAGETAMCQGYIHITAGEYECAGDNPLPPAR